LNTDSWYATAIASTATRHGVDPALAMAVAYQESGFNQRRVSVANAIGTMQVIPSSGRWASDLVGRPLDLMEVNDNITAGVVILKSLLASAPSREQAIAGYYQGLGSVRKNGMYADTERYVANVQRLSLRFG
jgi:N-acetylmuramoyl-L-alanine amidase